MTKRLTIFILLLCLTLIVIRSSVAETASSDEIRCMFTAPAGREAAAEHLCDNDYRTRLTLTPGQSLIVSWEGEAGGVLLQWFNERQWYSRECRAVVRLFTAEGEMLSETEHTRLSYRMFLPVESASRMEILCPQGSKSMISLCEVKVCASGYEPTNLPKTEPVDLMLILSSVSEELDLLGGVLPLYAGEHGIKTAVVYVGRDNGNQVQEAFCAYEAMGLDAPLLFLQKEDHQTYNLSQMHARWDEPKLRDELGKLLFLCQPKIVVVCDPDDSFSPARTAYTAGLVRDLVVNRAERLGLGVRKLYHLAANGKTKLDCTVPLTVYGGRSAAEVAREGYAQYRSEVSYGTVIPETLRFTLAYTTVGADERGDDLFEHIDTDALIAYQAPTPLPTATPEATPTPEPTPTSTPAAEFTPAPAPTEAPMTEPEPTTTGRSGFMGLSDGTLALYAASGVFVVIALCLVKKRRTTALLLLVMAGLLAYVGYSLTRTADKEEDQAAETQTVVTATPLAQTPSPTDTAEPTEESTPEPTATPDPNDRYFRQEGEPAEVVIQDYDNGHWEYRSDILSVIIDREITRENQNHPYCKYIAHVRMRRINCFRSIVSTRYEIAMANELPWRMARNYRAVLAVTGDNLTNAEVDMKGILIRNGILYSDGTRESTMVMGDDFAMRLYHPGEASGLDLLDRGVLATYSFGPILVENGQLNPDANKHRVFKENPRCGVGMVEPGHFVVIVSDGRDHQRAYGYTLGEFAQLFVDQGVQTAYNLDGGSSAAMVFMGEHLNWHSADPQRPWADALVWGYSRLVPSVFDPIAHTGESPTS